MPMTLEDLKLDYEYVSELGVIRKIITIGDKRVFYKYRFEHCEQYNNEDSVPISQFLSLLPYVAPKKTKLVTVKVADYVDFGDHETVPTLRVLTTLLVEDVRNISGWKKVIGSEREIEIEIEE